MLNDDLWIRLVRVEHDALLLVAVLDDDARQVKVIVVGHHEGGHAGLALSCFLTMNSDGCVGLSVAAAGRSIGNEKEIVELLLLFFCVTIN